MGRMAAEVGPSGASSAIRCQARFFVKEMASTDIYTLSLHDALPIWRGVRRCIDTGSFADRCLPRARSERRTARGRHRSEEHTSELQSHHDIVCRLLLEKKKLINSVITDVIKSCK